MYEILGGCVCYNTCVNERTASLLLSDFYLSFNICDITAEIQLGNYNSKRNGKTRHCPLNTSEQVSPSVEELQRLFHLSRFQLQTLAGAGCLEKRGYNFLEHLQTGYVEKQETRAYGWLR